MRVHVCACVGVHTPHCVQKCFLPGAGYKIWFQGMRQIQKPGLTAGRTDKGAGGKAWQCPSRSGRTEEEGAKASRWGRVCPQQAALGQLGVHTSENEGDPTQPLTKVKVRATDVRADAVPS